MKRLLIIVAILLVVLIAGCWGNGLISWVDFIKFNDITYHADGYNYDNSLSFDDLGPQFDTVNFKVADNVHTTRYSTKNGDAAYLEKGTPVYTINGYAPEFRLAVMENYRVKIYEASQNPKAKIGADLLDIRNKVSYISINSETDNLTVLAKIEDQAIVDRMVEMILAAGLKDRDGSEYQGDRCFIALHLLDGTVVNRPYWIETGVLAPNIFLPEEFADHVRDALNN